MTAMMATIEAAVGTNQQFYRPWQRNEIHSKKILSREINSEIKLELARNKREREINFAYLLLTNDELYYNNLKRK